MTYALRDHPAKPAEDLQTLQDDQRAIPGGPLWCLATICANLSDLSLVYSGTAKLDAVEKLAWTADNAKAFLSQLSKARYYTSEWCYASNGRTPYAADAYVMGFNRHRGSENQRTDPWVYFKFSILTKTQKILVLSAHPEKAK